MRPLRQRFRTGVAATAMFLLAASRAFADPPGIGLAWDHCQGEAGAVQNKVFACDTNAGVDILYGTVTLAAPLDSVAGMDMELRIVSASPSLPSWWQLAPSGACRFGALSAPQFVDPTATTCEDWGNGIASGSYAWNAIHHICVPDLPPPNMVGLTIGAFVPIDQLQNLVAGQKYFVFSLRINHIRTVGAGACGGCEVPMCITFCGGGFGTEPGGVFNPTPTTPSIPGGNMVTWQGGSPSCLGATPTQRATWGSVKSLYR